MSLNQEEKGKLVVPYSPDQTFDALSKALKNKKSNYRIQKINTDAHTLLIKSGMSMKSWGETLQIVICPAQNQFSELMISSKSTFGLIDWGKNQENVNDIMTLLTDELNNGKYQKLQSSDNSNIPEQIKKLSALKNSGILTAEEFEAKKAELLARM